MSNTPLLENDTTGTKWKWVQTKISGLHFPPRCSMPITLSPNNTAYCFGGVIDEEDDENLSGSFYNDCYSLDLDKLVWRNVTVSGKKDIEQKPRRRKCKQDDELEDEEEMEVEEIKESIEKTTIADDGIFKVTLGPSKSDATTSIEQKPYDTKIFQPSGRMNCGLAVKHGCLYLYGGMFEDGDKQITYCDLYSLDLKKLDEWKIIVADDTSKQEWLASDDENESEENDLSLSDESDEDSDVAME